MKKGSDFVQGLSRIFAPAFVFKYLFPGTKGQHRAVGRSANPGVPVVIRWAKSVPPG